MSLMDRDILLETFGASVLCQDTQPANFRW